MAPAVFVKTSLFEQAVRRDHLVVLTGLISVCGAAWLYIFAGAGMEMGTTPSGSPTVNSTRDWTPAYLGLMFAMWWVMMIAMMLPGAAPMVLFFATINRKSGEQGRGHVPTYIFAAGYLVAWGGFSLGAVFLQWGLDSVTLLSPMMQTSSIYLGGALLIGGGLYQLTPLKHACLRNCRSPFNMIAHSWREGAFGAFRMGIEQGLFCLGCCWVLMALLFYGGVMNLWWITGLAIYVLIEKLAPAGHALGRYTGALLIVWGGWVIAGAIAAN
jgi:predicted metal-binding membrane protein